MVRYNRMKGRPTLWLPGTDHAGIATQVHFPFIVQIFHGISVNVCVYFFCAHYDFIYLASSHSIAIFPTPISHSFFIKKSFSCRVWFVYITFALFAECFCNILLNLLYNLQLVVEKMLASEGIKRVELGRDEFTKRVWEWKEKYAI